MSNKVAQVTVVCSGMEDPELSDFTNAYLAGLAEQCSVVLYDLDRMDVRGCLGCYVCNIKTPGVCIIKDEQVDILKAFTASDRLVLLTPLKEGFISGKMKTFIDRLYPMELPFIKIKNGHFIHDPRYKHNPSLGFILHKEPDTDGEDLEINLEINRFIGEFYGGFAFQYTTGDRMEEIVRETVRH